MKKLSLFLALALLASPVLAASPELEALLAGIFAPAVPPTMVSEGIEADCTAYCWDGSTVFCSGPTCSVTDSNCAAGIRGYCTANGVTTYCPVPCPSCTATASCANAGGGSVSCTGTSTCSYRNNCWAMCDGEQYWCPNPASNCPR